MYHDPIVEEIHRIRQEYSQSFNHDLKALFADLQKQQAASGRKVVNLSRKHCLTTRWSEQSRVKVRMLSECFPLPPLCIIRPHSPLSSIVRSFSVENTYYFKKLNNVALAANSL